VLLPIALALGGCDTTTSPSNADSHLDAADLALFLSAADGSGADLGSSQTGSFEFERTRECPAGGSHSVSGTRSRIPNAETGIVAVSWTTVQTHTACAITRVRNGQDYTVVIDGSVTANGSATYRVPEAPGQARELLSYSNARNGSTTMTSGDRTRTCDVSVTESYNPETESFTVSGTICGREVSLTRTDRLKQRER
jgi:hypothetical protein